MSVKTRRILAIVPIAVLVALQAVSIAIFKADAILGPSQVALLTAAGICIIIATAIYKTKWKEFEKAISGNVGEVANAILILLLIGAISGTWTMSGVVPAFICYGLKIISPKVFLLTACALCAIVSVLTGSSWTTIATIGVALIGIGRAEGFSDAMTAGAIISGAYFGDKISPLSDTTVLASSVNKVDLFTHIRYMLLTTGPAIIITLIIFTVIGIFHKGADAQEMSVYADVLASRFNITPWLLIVPIIAGILIWRKLPAIVVLALSALTAAIAALIFQPDVIAEIGAKVADGSRVRIMFAGTLESVYNSVALQTGNANVDALVATRGMLGMLNTVYLIICAMCFGACMKASGMIADLAGMLTPLTRTRAGLVGTTVFTGTALNGIVSDQYLAVILTSNIYRESYDKGGYERRLLSRSVEDSATVTSPLFPWSSCGMTQATILSVPTLAYAPFCFFNLISPLMSILVAIIGWRIVRAAPEITTSPEGR
ncbi:MAG: sodium:proton antiporter [Bacteroidales bacterium]|nr:sodium:proton antiporter [Bacteroidales bacterium]